MRPGVPGHDPLAPLPVLSPEWPAPPQVKALSTLRRGGVSEGAFGLADASEGGLNLGEHVGDDPACVAVNRALLQARVPGPIRWMQQVHGIRVLDADAESLHAVPPVADAAITSRPDTVLAVMTADCLPVLLCDERASAVALAHAGWRGLAEGVLEVTVAAMRARVGHRARLLAWLGPAIGPTAFEVGEEVRRAFTDRDPEAMAEFAPGPAPGKWWADLTGLARRRLERCGEVHISGGTRCTVSEPESFFSHRRDRVSGRMASLVWLSR
jgi:YfiH family protein